jgi:glycerol uptake facilitator-like aquaporin
MAYAVGHISGGHFNPAVTLGLWAGGRFPAKDIIGYIVAQVKSGLIQVYLTGFTSDDFIRWQMSGDQLRSLFICPVPSHCKGYGAITDVGCI